MLIKSNAPCHGDCSTDQALSSKDAKANLGPKETVPQIKGSGADSLGTPMYPNRKLKADYFTNRAQTVN